MAEVYIDALHNYLNGPEWHQSIQIFVDSNCKYFSNVSELDHQQHALWKTFQEIVETVLEMALETIGGSFQQLEDAIDALQSQPSRGPRDEKTKDLLTQLMSFTDFATFAAMMNQAYVENNDTCQDERRSNDKHVDALLRLGFPLEAIDATIEAAAPHSSLEDLVIAISGYQSELPKKGARISFAHCNAGDAKYHYDEHDSAPSSPRPVEPEDTFAAPLAKFASEAAEDGEKIDLNELNAKFVIADSVLDSFDLSVRVELAPGSAMQALLRWAEDMRMLRHDVCIAYEEQLPSVTMCFNCKDGLVEWYRQLERARQEIDQASAAGSMLSDAELHRMAELDKIAAMGTADEQLLHSLISRHDQVCKEVEALQRQASLLMASDSSRGVRRETLEELYVFLKQQVANGADLEAVGDEMHERVYSAVSSSRGAEVVNLLLDMHIHEDEQALLESRIHSIVGSPGRERAAEPAAVKLSDLELDEVAAASAKGVDDGTRAHSATAPTQASSMFAADSKGSVGGGLVPSSAAALVDDPHVQSLKDQHRAALVQLKQLLTADKERKLQALEEKLLRRRALLQKSRQQQQGAESAALEAEQLRAVQEVEAEIVQAQDSCELRTESMVSGFKKRCTSELTVARAKGAGSDIAPGDKKNSAVAWELTEEERSEAHRLAAQALKERFEREQKALLASLDEERHKQHDRILKQLAAKRKKAQQAGRTAEELAAEEREALVAMNVEFDQMQATALGKAQERAFLSLAAMHVSTSQLDLKQGQQEAAEEGSYLDEADQGYAGGRQWLETVDRVRECYTGAAAELQLRLRASAVSSAGKREDGDSLSAFTETAGMMSRVVADAFEKQCQEECGDHAAASKLLSSSSSKHGGARADTARVRAGIMEEFERARRELEDSFAHSQQSGRNRTDLRRQSRSQHKEASGDQREGSMEESEEGDAELMRSQQLLLEGVVDSYLGGEPVPDIATVYAQSERAQAARSSSGDTYSAARRESQEWEEGDRLRERARIKSVHVEKEQSLLLQLEADMLDKKRALEDRLRRRRQSTAASSEGEGGVTAEVEDVKQQEQLLEQAFSKISAHLKGMTAEQLAKLDVRAMADFLERSSLGERPALPAPSLPSALQTNATLIRPVGSAGTDETESTGVDAMGLWKNATTGRSREEKESMAGEVKRISLEYSEEKQKLDLMMKIQQARQRQALQRKLFEKSQRKAQQQMVHGGQEHEADSKSEYNSVEIGANRGLAALKLRSPSSLQPAFKGLPPEAYQQGGAPSVGGGAGYSSSCKPQSQQSMALRGMNLGPMMRK